MAKIIRMRDREKGYTNIRNSIFLEKGLSLKATGLYCLMWSLPDDWQFSINGLAQITADGPDSIRSALIELGEHRFMNRVRMRTETGTLAGMDYQLWETPTLENPTQVNPRQETTQEESTNSISKREERRVRKEESKRVYGILNNVLLTDIEYSTLQTMFPGDYSEKIDDLSTWLKSNGKVKKDHYATILNWSRREKKLAAAAPAPRRREAPIDYD